jgi:uncharacterized protein DUF4126
MRSEALEIALQVVAGIGLASCAGLRAFLPLFLVGAAARAGLIGLGEAFGWLDSTPALVTLGTAVAAEILADKVPAVDHLLDAVGFLVKPVAGALVMASTLSDVSPLAATLLAVILGLPVAAGIHLIKAKARFLSTTGTLGLANPVISLAEDAATLAGSVLSILLPISVLAIGVLVLTVLAFRRRRGGRRTGS